MAQCIHRVGSATTVRWAACLCMIVMPNCYGTLLRTARDAPRFFANAHDVDEAIKDIYRLLIDKELVSQDTWDPSKKTVKSGSNQRDLFFPELFFKNHEMDMATIFTKEQEDLGPHSMKAAIKARVTQTGKNMTQYDPLRMEMTMKVEENGTVSKPKVKRLHPMCETSTASFMPNSRK